MAEVTVGGRARAVLLGVLALVAVATVVGAVLTWPDREQADAVRDDFRFAAPGVTFHDAEVTAIAAPCPRRASERTAEQGCGTLTVRVTDGAAAGERAEVSVPPEAAAAVSVGDDVRLLRTPAVEGAPAQYSYFGIARTTPLLWLTLALVVTVIAVARLRGLLALVSLGLTGLALLGYLLPALVTGEPPVLAGMVAAAAIVFVVLYLTHGPSMRTSAAVAGTLSGVVMTAAAGWLAVRVTDLTGVADEGGAILATAVGGLDFQGLVTCAVVIAGLGVLNDVTITQASAVWELRAAAADRSRRHLFTGAMRIGRDHIASTIYTIVFVYAGTALAVLMLLQLYGLPVRDLLATEEIAEEVVRTLASTLALVLAVPVTTAIAAATVPAATARLGVD